MFYVLQDFFRYIFMSRNRKICYAKWLCKSFQLPSKIFTINLIQYNQNRNSIFSQLWVTASLIQAYANTALCNWNFITSQYCLIYLSLGVTLTLCGVFSELCKLKDHYFRASFIMCYIITEEAVFSESLENRFVIVEYIDFF